MEQGGVVTAALAASATSNPATPDGLELGEVVKPGAGLAVPVGVVGHHGRVLIDGGWDVEDDARGGPPFVEAVREAACHVGRAGSDVLKYHMVVAHHHLNPIGRPFAVGKQRVLVL